MTTLMVCLDSLGYSLLTKENTPYLYELSKELNKARLKTLLAFKGVEQTLFTGQPPTKTNIWMELKYTKSLFKYYKYIPLNNKILTYPAILHQLIKKRTNLITLENIPKNLLKEFDVSTTQNIWKTSFFQNKSFICYKWPFFIKNNKKTIDFFKKTDSQKIKKLIKNIQSNIDLYYIHLTDLDKFIHQNKTNSKETIKKLNQIDNQIKFLIQAFQKQKNSDIILWSDHSQVNIENLINIQKLMPKSKDYTAFYGGTTVSFWFKNNNIKEEITNILKKTKQGKILTKQDKKHYQIPDTKEYGDLIFLIQPKYLIFPNYYQKTKPFKAMHGYAPDKADLDGFIITNKKIPKTLTLEQAYKILKEV